MTLNIRHISRTALAIALAAICTTGYAQNNGANYTPIIVPKGSEAVDQAITDDNTIYTSVKIMPEFPGGESALHKYIADNLQYPRSPKIGIAKRQVWVQFVIGKDGKVESQSVATGYDINPELNTEIIRVIKSMPQWAPGIRYEYVNEDTVKTPARVSMCIPVDVTFSDEDVFLIVDDMPEFPDGNLAMRKYLAEHTQYPDSARYNGLSGKVIVSFVINQRGEMENVKIARGVAPPLDKEAIRVVKSIPQKFKPGRLNGKPVKVLMTATISFELDKYH